MTPAERAREIMARYGVDIPSLAADIAAAIAAAEMAQVQRDAAAICRICADGDKWAPAEWSDVDDNYYHQLKHGKHDPEWCEANRIWSDWEEQHAPETEP